MKTTEEQKAKATALKEALKAQGVKYCVGAYVDIHGVPKGKFVPIDHFEHFAAGSELYTGYALDGLGQRPPVDDRPSVGHDVGTRSHHPRYAGPAPSAK